jgi:hypothetical protein
VCVCLRLMLQAPVTSPRVTVAKRLKRKLPKQLYHRFIIAWEARSNNERTRTRGWR